MKKTLLLAGLSLLSSFALADCQLPAFHATYSLSAGGKHLGQVDNRLTLVDGKFRFTSDVHVNVKVLFIHYSDFITATSVGVITDNRFQSQHFIFSEQRKHQHVNRPVKSGDFDSQSVVLSVRSALIAGKTPPSTESVWFNKKLQRVGIKVSTKPATLTTALGRVKTREVTMRFSDGTQARYWLAPKFHYVVVKNATTNPHGKSMYRLIGKYTPNAKQCVIS